jgi:GT2 family glycosyltransferase
VSDVLACSLSPDEVIVTDTDGHGPLLRKKFSGLTVLEFGNNFGAAAALNAGFRLAKGELVLALQSPIRVQKRCAELLARAIRAEEGCAAAQPKILMEQDPDFIYSLGMRIDRSGGWADLGFCAPEREAAGSAEALLPSEAACMYSSEAVRDLGLFDEAYFRHGHTVDFGIRALRRGWKTRPMHEALCWKPFERRREDYLLNRNRLRLLLKLAPAHIMWEELFRAASRDLLGNAAIPRSLVLRAWLWNLAQARAYARHRKALKGRIFVPWPVFAASSEPDWPAPDYHPYNPASGADLHTRVAFDGSRDEQLGFGWGPRQMRDGMPARRAAKVASLFLPAAGPLLAKLCEVQIRCLAVGETPLSVKLNGAAGLETRLQKGWQDIRTPVRDFGQVQKVTLFTPGGGSLFVAWAATESPVPLR